MALEFGFIGLTLLVTLFLIFIGFKAINATSKNINKHKLILVFCLAIWQVYIWQLTETGLLTNHSFPPLFAFAFIIPSFLFTGVFLFKNRNKNWIHHIPERWIVLFQSFRILVEILFVFALANGIFNYHVTIEGYNFDMIFALTAPIISYLVYNKKAVSNKIIIIWNYLGLAVLASVILLFLTSMYKPELYGSTTPLLPLEALTYPYVLIAGFLMPVAVFLHVLSIMQVKGKI